MIFSNTSLISQAITIRAIRNMVTQVAPNLGPILDHDQIIAAIALACGDLDAADPLIVFRTLDTTAYKGLTAPLIKVSSRHYGDDIIALYQPAEVVDANQITFDLAANYQVRPRVQVTETSMMAVIQWPRNIEPIPYTDSPYEDPSSNWADVRCLFTKDPANGFTEPAAADGLIVHEGERVLCKDFTGLTTTKKNGIYTLHSNVFIRTTDADSAGDFALNKCVRVLEGDTCADTIWSITTTPTLFGTDPIVFTQLTYSSNVTSAQAIAHIIPRAAAWIGLQLVPAIVDKNIAASITAWANAILARPLPMTRPAISHRISTGTTYATNL